MATGYNDYTDEQLIERVREGDSDIIDYLMEKYKHCVRSEANAMFLIGGETEGLIQEGMIGLFKAVRDYDPAHESSFYSFARLCIRRQMYTAIKASNRQKNQPLNTYIPFSDADSEDGVEPAADGSNPEEQVISREYTRVFMEQLNQELSGMEHQVLDLYLEGENYTRIAEILGKSPKSIDNTLQRIKKKVKLLAERV